MESILSGLLPVVGRMAGVLLWAAAALIERRLRRVRQRANWPGKAGEMTATYAHGRAAAIGDRVAFTVTAIDAAGNLTLTPAGGAAGTFTITAPAKLCHLAEAAGEPGGGMRQGKQTGGEQPHAT